MHIIQRDFENERQGKLPRTGMWGVWSGNVMVRCPVCGKVSNCHNHSVQIKDGASGYMSPSLVCGHKECSFHEYVELADFSTGRAATPAPASTAASEQQVGADEQAIVAGLKGLATHIRAAPHYARLLGDMCIVDQAIAALTRRATTTMCPTCNGNDANVPCAYPSKGMPGCLRTERILALERRSPMSDDPLSRPCSATNNR